MLDSSDNITMVQLLESEPTALPADKHVLLGVFYPAVSEYASIQDVTGIRFGILAGDRDWKRNQATYEAMVAYVRSHQYFARPDFRNTLFLSTGDFHGNFSVMIPFHDSWIDHTEPSGDVVITPANVKDADQGPAFRLTHDRFLLNLKEGEAESVAWERLKQWAVKFYNLPDSTAWSPVPSCVEAESAKPTAFKNGDRMGYVYVWQDYVVGVYAPAADWARYRTTLSTMLQSFASTYCTPG